MIWKIESEPKPEAMHTISNGALPLLKFKWQHPAWHVAVSPTASHLLGHINSCPRSHPPLPVWPRERRIWHAHVERWPDSEKAEEGEGSACKGASHKLSRKETVRAALLASGILSPPPPPEHVDCSSYFHSFHSCLLLLTHPQYLLFYMLLLHTHVHFPHLFSGHCFPFILKWRWRQQAAFKNITFQYKKAIFECPLNFPSYLPSPCPFCTHSWP